MKTVVQVVQHLQPGGIEVLALELARFAVSGHRTLIISLEGTEEQALARWPRLEPFAESLFFLNKRPGKDPLLLWRLIKTLHQVKADVVHTHHIGPLLYAGLAARLTSSAKLIHTEHDAWHLADHWRQTLQRTAMHLIRPVTVADAQNVAQGMKSYLRLDADKVIHNGVDTERFKPGSQWLARHALGLPKQVTLVGASGRLEWEKGHCHLIEALVHLPSYVHLAIAGQGSMMDKLQKQAQDLLLTHRVHFLGQIDDMPTFYQGLDLFCLPSLKEGMPLSPLEAQACAIPALVTATGSARESLCSETGQLVQKSHYRLLAKGIQAYLARQAISEMKRGPLPSPRDFVIRQGDIRRTAAAYGRLYASAS